MACPHRVRATNPDTESSPVIVRRQGLVDSQQAQRQRPSVIPTTSTVKASLTDFIKV